MQYLEEKPLFEAPKYYRNPTGIGAFSNLSNAVRKGRSELILTTEYTESERISSNTIYFRKLKNKYTYETINYGLFGDTGISGVYIKGVITWSDNTQSSFSTINNISIDNGVISLEVNVYDRTPVKATLRISQLQ